MIDVWLKIRKRGNENNLVLKYLNFWLGLFSDKSKYNVYICNKDVNLPHFYKRNYNLISDDELLNNNNCKDIKAKIQKSNVLSSYWKKTAFALSAPYFYLDNNVDYVYNIDADDMFLYGVGDNVFDQLFDILKTEGLTTISYDYMFSKNLFSLRNLFPHYWTFGINLSEKSKMKNLLNNSMFVNSDEFIKEYGNSLNKEHEVCLDMLVSNELLKRSNDKYHSFITPHIFTHCDFYYSKYDVDSDKVFVNYSGVGSNGFLPMNGLIDKHNKTLLVK